MLARLRSGRPPDLGMVSGNMRQTVVAGHAGGGGGVQRGVPRLLCMVFVSALVCGCGGDGASPPASSSDTATRVELPAARPADFSLHLMFRHGSGMQPSIGIDLVGSTLTFVEGVGDARQVREVTLKPALLDEIYALARRVPSLTARAAPIRASDKDYLLMTIAGGSAALTVRSDVREPDPADYAVLERLSAIGRGR